MEVSIPTGYAYWTCYIRPTHERFLPASVVVPNELMLDWASGKISYFVVYPITRCQWMMMGSGCRPFSRIVIYV